MRRIVLENSALQTELRAVSDREDFINQLIDLALSFGLQIDSDDIAEAMRDSRRAWVERWI